MGWLPRQDQVIDNFVNGLAKSRHLFLRAGCVEAVSMQELLRGAEHRLPRVQFISILKPLRILGRLEDRMVVMIMIMLVVVRLLKFLMRLSQQCSIIIIAIVEKVAYVVCLRLQQLLWNVHKT